MPGVWRYMDPQHVVLAAQKLYAAHGASFAKIMRDALGRFLILEGKTDDPTLTPLLESMLGGRQRRGDAASLLEGSGNWRWGQTEGSRPLDEEEEIEDDDVDDDGYEDEWTLEEAWDIDADAEWQPAGKSRKTGVSKWVRDVGGKKQYRYQDKQPGRARAAKKDGSERKANTKKVKAETPDVETLKQRFADVLAGDDPNKAEALAETLKGLDRKTLRALKGKLESKVKEKGKNSDLAKSMADEAVERARAKKDQETPAPKEEPAPAPEPAGSREMKELDVGDPSEIPWSGNMDVPSDWEQLTSDAGQLEEMTVRDVADIRPSEEASRSAIDAMKEYISDPNNDLPPIIVERDDDGFYILDGNTRFRAAKELGYKKIPVREVASQEDPAPVDDDEIDLMGDDPAEDVTTPAATTPEPAEETGNRSLHELSAADMAKGKFRPMAGDDDDDEEIDANRGVGTVEVGGQKFFWKKASEKETKEEEFMSRLCDEAGVRAPATRYAVVPGTPTKKGERGGMMAEMVEGKPLSHYFEKAPKGRSARQTFDELQKKLRPGEVDRMALFDFLVGSGDRNSGNFLVEGDRLVSIDHADSFWSDGGRFNDPGMDAHKDMIGLDTGVLGFRPDAASAVFDPAVVKELAGKADAIADEIAKQNPEAGAVAKRHADVLRRLADSDDTSYANLGKLLAEEMKGGGGGATPEPEAKPVAVAAEKGTQRHYDEWLKAEGEKKTLPKNPMMLKALYRKQFGVLPGSKQETSAPPASEPEATPPATPRERPTPPISITADDVFGDDAEDDTISAADVKRMQRQEDRGREASDKEARILALQKKYAGTADDDEEEENDDEAPSNKRRYTPPTKPAKDLPKQEKATPRDVKPKTTPEPNEGEALHDYLKRASGGNMLGGDKIKELTAKHAAMASATKKSAAASYDDVRKKVQDNAPRMAEMNHDEYGEFVDSLGLENLPPADLKKLSAQYGGAGYGTAPKPAATPVAHAAYLRDALMMQYSFAMGEQGGGNDRAGDKGKQNNSKNPVDDSATGGKMNSGGGKAPTEGGKVKKSFKKLGDAAFELQDVRNALASGDADVDELLARVDAVGEWVAANGKQTGLAAKLLGEASELHDKVQGGSGKGGVRIKVGEPSKAETPKTETPKTATPKAAKIPMKKSAHAYDDYQVPDFGTKAELLRKADDVMTAAELSDFRDVVEDWEKMHETRYEAKRLLGQQHPNDYSDDEESEPSRYGPNGEYGFDEEEPMNWHRAYDRHEEARENQREFEKNVYYPALRKLMAKIAASKE